MWLRTRMQEVIPMKKSKPYSALPVNRVSLEVLIRGRVGQDVVVGFDIGKFEILTVPRWGNNDFNRPWRVSNPEQIPDLVRLLVQLGHGRRLRVALEPSGTYGDPLRQACHDAGLSVWRVSPKAAHDYAEIFDGTLSQHDGKDAGVVAELAGVGQGDGVAVYGQARVEQQLAYWVDWLERSGNCWCCGRVAWRDCWARYWPEATRVLKVTKATLLHALIHYGGPAALAADGQADQWLGAVGRQLVWLRRTSGVCSRRAQSSVGIRQGRWSSSGYGNMQPRR